MFVGTVSTTVLIDACKNPETEKPNEASASGTPQNADRMAEEISHDKELRAEKFFTPHEMATIAVLSDIIIPADDISGSATEAGVPDFIEFMVKDRPQNQIPMRGGLRWLDVQCMNAFDKPFKDCSAGQQIEMVDKIAYPEKAKPEFRQGVSFFTLMRNLTISGFYTSKIGLKDIGYQGNVPNQWNGVPEDVLKQYNLSYTEKELSECISFDKT